MASINDPSVTAMQYATDEGLSIRMMLHRKYSVNQQPYFDWVMEHYRIHPGMEVLELGCGNGVMWGVPERWLPEGANLLLTDVSEGMLERARANIPNRKNISFAQVDIQQIPYEDRRFDLVIANAMLYHVPDLDRALSEAGRVLKKDGRFLCTTTGNNGMHSWLQRVLGEGESPVLPFSLQNGTETLQKHFGRVERFIREDGLAVTDVNNLAAYVRSTLSFSYVRKWPEQELRDRLAQEMQSGVIRIPKEYGIFQSYEPNVTKNFD